MTKSLFLGVALSLLPSPAVSCAPYGTGAPAGIPGGGTTVVGGPFLYVANQDAASVTVIDLASNEVAEIIDLAAMGYGPTAKPHDIAVEPDGSYWYVSLIAANTVLKFDRDNELVASVEFERPGLLAMHPTEDWLFVGRSMAAVNPPQRIGRIVRSTMEMEEFDVYVPRPHALAISPDGKTVYVGSLSENTIVTLDAESGEADLSRLEETEPHVLVQFAISPDGATLVATGQLSAKLLVFDISGGGPPTLEREIDVEAQPWHPSYTPDGGEVWFGNLMANVVTVIDADSWTVEAVITDPAITEPHGSTIGADGMHVYVSNRNTKAAYAAEADFGFETPASTLVVIDTSTHEVVSVIEMPPYGAGVGLASSPPR